MGKITVQVKQWLDKCYSDAAQSEITVMKWYTDFKCDRTDTNNAERVGYFDSFPLDPGWYYLL